MSTATSAPTTTEITNLTNLSVGESYTVDISDSGNTYIMTNITNAESRFTASNAHHTSVYTLAVGESKHICWQFTSWEITCTQGEINVSCY